MTTFQVSKNRIHRLHNRLRHKCISHSDSSHQVKGCGTGSLGNLWPWGRSNLVIHGHPTPSHPQRFHPHFLQTLGRKQSQWGLTQQSSPLALKFTRFLHIIKPQEPFYKCHHHSLLIFYIKNCIHSLQNFYVNIISSPLCHLSVYLKNKKKQDNLVEVPLDGEGSGRRDTRGRFILCTEMQRKFHTALETALREKKNNKRFQRGPNTGYCPLSKECAYVHK